jgi:hypothetical protein
VGISDVESSRPRSPRIVHAKTLITRRRLLYVSVAVLVVLAAVLVHVERLAFAQSPEQAVARYAEGVMRGDEAGALAAWSAPMSRPQQAWIDALSRRRALVTSDLSATPLTGYRIIGIEWWRTCCEPGIAERPEYAGVARLRVAFESSTAPSREYYFDVRKDPSCCIPGDPFEGLQLRYWTLLDVYPTTKLPLQFTWVYDAKSGSHPLPGLPEP